jgi:hypothetical protein
VPRPAHLLYPQPTIEGTRYRVCLWRADMLAGCVELQRGGKLAVVRADEAAGEKLGVCGASALGLR